MICRIHRRKVVNLICYLGMPWWRKWSLGHYGQSERDTVDESIPLFSRKGITYSYFYCLSAIWQISFRWMYCMLTFQGLLLCQSSFNLQLHFLFLFMKIKQYIQITMQFQVIFPSFIKVRNNANYTVLTILRIIKILGMHYLLWHL